LKGAFLFSLWKQKRSETKEAEEHCWATTLAAGRSCRVWSCSSFWISNGLLTCTYTVDHYVQ